MRIALSWLKQWTSYALSDADLAEQLSVSGLEATILSSELTPFNNVFVGEITAVNPHPNANRLSVCEVKCQKVNTTIVCGAFNVRQGLKVAVALPGAKLPNHTIISPTKIRGLTSQGMLCSLSELALDTLFIQEVKTEGIWELPTDFPVGVDLWEYLGLGDALLDLQVPPNRGDCLSVMGFAREINTLQQLDCKHPSPTTVDISASNTLAVQVAHPVACPRYTGRVIVNLNPSTKTPWWIVTRLHQGGIRSINAVVDILNYSLLELGSPLHAFDLDQLSGSLSVRAAKQGESIQLLNTKTVVLEEGTLVIADQKGLVAIAGIMGGLASGVTDKTVNIFLESAFFTPTTIMGKARQYELTTEASYRFERGVDPKLCKEALEKTTALLISICGGESGPILAAEAPLPGTRTIHLNHNHITKVLGMIVPATTVEEQLERIGMTILSATHAKSEIKWELTPPSWRFDIKESVDLIEEIARLLGYNNISDQLPHYAVSLSDSSAHHSQIKSLKSFLVHQGYYEVINYSFCSSEHQQLLDPNTVPIQLTNPISKELNLLRTQLWPNLLKNLQHNQHYYQDGYQFFESGTVFTHDSSGITEHLKIGGIVAGNRLPDQWGVASETVDFFDVKQTVDNSLKLIDSEGRYTYHAASHAALHPGQSTQLLKDDNQPIGWLGALHPQLYQHFDLTGPVYLFEWELTQSPTYKAQFAPFARFPYVKRDIAFWIANNIAFDAIKEAILLEGGDYLKDLRLFDVYQPNDQPTKRSLALSLVWQDSTKTLTDHEADVFQARIVQTLQKEFNIVIRNK